MASVRGARRVGVRTGSRPPVGEEIVPDSGWTEDPAAHYLLVDLPGFKKEEVKLQLDGSGRIIAKGERQVNEDKRLHFELTFPAPMNSDIDNISGKFEGEILHVTVPKRIIQEEKEIETEKANENVAARAEEENKHEEQSAKDDMKDESKQEEHTGVEERRTERIRDQYEDKSHRNEIGSFPKELIRKWEQEPSIIKNAVELLRKNKGIVVTAVLAFSLGVYVSRKFQS